MIEVDGLTKRFGATVALAGVSFEVPRGAILGLLGPNGAGKTTALRILTTLTMPDAGSARVAGFDVVHQAAAVRRNIGVAAQDATLDETLTGTAEPRHGGAPERTQSSPRRPTARRGAPRAVRACRGDGPHPQAVLRGHAATPRRGGDSRRATAGALLRRADDGTRPVEPGPRLGHHPRPRRRGRHGASHDAVPRRGRRARRPHRRA